MRTEATLWVKLSPPAQMNGAWRGREQRRGEARGRARAYVAKVRAAIEEVLLVLELARAHDLALRVPLLQDTRVVSELKK